MACIPFAAGSRVGRKWHNQRPYGPKGSGISPRVTSHDTYGSLTEEFPRLILTVCKLCGFIRPLPGSSHLYICGQQLHRWKRDEAWL